MVTTYDIAKKAGLNQSTVSRVLSGSALVNPKTAEKVWQVCKELNYVPNAQARALRTQQTQTLAVYLPQYSETVLADPFVPAFLSGVSKEAAAAGYGVVLCYQDAESKEQPLLDMVQSRRADGVILASPALQDPVLEKLLAAGIPLVTGRVDRKLVRHVNCVDIDNQHAGRQATQFLLQRHRARRIGLIAEEPASLTGRDFEKGFCQAMQAWRVPVTPELMKRVPVTFAAAREAADEILRAAPDVDAILADTALAVFGVLQAVAQHRSKAVVLGVESPLLRAMHPELPQIRSPIQELGGRMARVLIEQFKEPHRETVRQMLYTTIVDEQGHVISQEVVNEN